MFVILFDLFPPLSLCAFSFSSPPGVTSQSTLPNKNHLIKKMKDMFSLHTYPPYQFRARSNQWYLLFSLSLYEWSECFRSTWFIIHTINFWNEWNQKPIENGQIDKRFNDSYLMHQFSTNWFSIDWNQELLILQIVIDCFVYVTNWMETTSMEIEKAKEKKTNTILNVFIFSCKWNCPKVITKWMVSNCVNCWQQDVFVFIIIKNCF